MPAFPKPTFNYEYQYSAQVDALREYRDTAPGRTISAKATNRLLVATWNVANLGVQERRDKDYLLIAEVVNWFDLVAMQEVNDNLSGLRAIHKHLPPSFRLLFSDASGNEERLAFIYDSTKVALLEEVGEVAIPPSDISDITLPGITQRFEGFDRNPYLAGFSSGSFVCVLVNVHLYFGSENANSMNRRSLETYAVARWADLRRKSRYAYSRDVIALGDFNLPKTEPGDPIYEALTSRGLHLPEHSTQIGSAIATDSHYDQVAFFPGETQQEFTGNSGVFDFDGALFRTLWEERTQEEFFAYVRYYISDHRPLWAVRRFRGGSPSFEKVLK
jgi:endonuclease/exonuclease/phosphatase family metal-dependent hydrolase